MQFVNIGSRTITVALTPEDCRRLAIACEVAAAWVTSSIPNIDRPDTADAAAIAMAIFETTGAALDAAALAGAVVTYVPVGDGKTLTLKNMRVGMLTDPLWPAV